MIIEALIMAITGVIKLLALPFNILPDTPPQVIEAMDYYFDLVFNNLDFLSFFINVDTLKTVAIISIAIWAFDHAYSFLIWILHKLPVSIT